MSSGLLHDRVALVTGAGRRLGRILALELARAGADLILHANRSRSEAETLGREIEALGRRARVLCADLTDPGAIDRLAADVAASPGQLDILVNSAAVYERAPLEELTARRWDDLMAINLRAPALLIRAVRPLLDRSPAAAIVNVVDVAGVRPWAWHLHYAVSKAGLVAVTRCLALELAPRIRVNAVAPGTVLPAAFQSEDDLAGIAARTPLGRLATPEEVGKAVLFLASGPAALTGQVLVVDGGRSLNAPG